MAAGFGVGVGDIIAVSQLAHKLYQGCKNASRQYQTLIDDVSTFCAAVGRLQEAFPNDSNLLSRLDRQQGEALQKILHGIKNDVSDWLTHLDGHQKVTDGSKRAIFKFATVGDVIWIRQGLASQSRAMMLFLSTYQSSRLQHIEGRLEQILEEVQQGNRELKLQAVSGAEDSLTLADSQWSNLQNELLSDGFVAEDIAAHKDWLETRLRKSTPSGQVTVELSREVDPPGSSSQSPPKDVSKAAKASPLIGRGRRLSTESTNVRRGASRTASVRSDISEYDGEGQLVRRKVVTTTYSDDNPSRVSQRRNSATEVQLSRSNDARAPETRAYGRATPIGPRQFSFNNLFPRVEKSPSIRQSQQNYRPLYDSRLEQLKLLVQQIVDADVIERDPLSYKEGPDQASDWFAIKSIGRALKEKIASIGDNRSLKVGVTSQAGDPEKVSAMLDLGALSIEKIDVCAWMDEFLGNDTPMKSADVETTHHQSGSISNDESTLEGNQGKDANPHRTHSRNFSYPLTHHLPVPLTSSWGESTTALRMETFEAELTNAWRMARDADIQHKQATWLLEAELELQIDEHQVERKRLQAEKQALHHRLEAAEDLLDLLLGPGSKQGHRMSDAAPPARLLPRFHTCASGKNCAVWRRQERELLGLQKVLAASIKRANSPALATCSCLVEAAQQEARVLTVSIPLQAV